MYYLMCYEQWTGRQFKKANTVTDKTPAHWLLTAQRADPGSTTTLLWATEISKDEYLALKGDSDA